MSSRHNKNWQPVVYVVKGPTWSKNWYLRWIKPNGKPKQVSAGTRIRRDANRIASETEERLIAQNARRASDWEPFAQEYRDHHLASKSADMKKQFTTSENRFLAFAEDYLESDRLSLEEIDEELIQEFTQRLVSEKLSPSSINNYLAGIRGFVRWCNKNRRVPTVVPNFELIFIPKQDRSRGRPLLESEIQRLCDAAEQRIGHPYFESWTHFIWGVRFSGLRLEEAITLTWDDTSTICVSDLGSETPMLCFPVQKGNRSLAMHPILPEFCDFLRRTPYAKRTGHVFNILTKTGKLSRSKATIGREIQRIGERAEIVVKIDNNGKKHFATAHDLRRSFANSGAALLDRESLMSATRHASTDCLETFYLKSDAQKESLKIQGKLGTPISAEQ